MNDTRTNAAIAAEVKAARAATAHASASLIYAQINRKPPERIAECQRAYKDAKRAQQECEIRATAEREAKRDAKNRRDVHRHIAKRKAAFPDRAVIIKSLGMLGSEHDGEVIAAARMVERIRAKGGLSWSRLIVQIVPSFDPGVE